MMEETRRNVSELIGKLPTVLQMVYQIMDNEDQTIIQQRQAYSNLSAQYPQEYRVIEFTFDQFLPKCGCGGEHDGRGRGRGPPPNSLNRWNLPKNGISGYDFFVESRDGMENGDELEIIVPVSPSIEKLDWKVLIIDTGCGCGDIYAFVKQQTIIKEKKIIVVNTHNHPEQTGGNFRFSTTGKLGMAHMVEDLCASGRDKYYTQLRNSNWHWEINTYKVTRWLSDGDTILLGNPVETHNVVKVIWSPGHTPDSLVLWYASDNRLFVGDLFYRFEDIMMTIDEAEGFRFETRDKAMRIVISREIVRRLNQAREKAQQYR
nr:Protein of unknown function DUF148 and Beta-lactamase domain containing protein [Haemonchus contortus]